MAIDPVMAVVDLTSLVRDLATMVGERLGAAKRLPETVARVKRTVGQVVGATQDIQLDGPTEHALATIKLKLEEVGRCLDRLEGTGERGGKAFTALGRCCGLMSQGHDVLAIEAEFDRLDGEIKSELQELVKATALHAYWRSAAMPRSSTTGPRRGRRGRTPDPG